MNNNQDIGDFKQLEEEGEQGDRHEPLQSHDGTEGTCEK